MLKEAGIASDVCTGIQDMVARLADGVGLVVVADEATKDADLQGLSAWINAQPTWSDLPFVVLTRQGGGAERNPAVARLVDTLGNVAFLERPFHPTTLVSIVQTGLRGRRRQYEARARLEELHESGERLRVALDAGQLGAWELDLKTRHLSASDQCKANFGRRPDEPLTNSEIYASVHVDDRVRMQTAVADAIRNKTPYEIAYRCIWPDGTLHWVEISARLRLDEQGIPLSIVGVSTDITDRKLAEAELRRLNETLEHRVVERTLALATANRQLESEMTARTRAQDQLRQSQKMEAIGQLTGGIAHDFNNMLAIVIGSLDLLKRNLAKGQHNVERFAESALEGANRAAALTHRLLAFSRRQPLDPKPTQVSRLVGSMEDLLRRSIGEKIAMKLVMPDDLWLTLCDQNQLESAILNLAINARDAMPDGGRLTIESFNTTLDKTDINASVDVRSGKYICISVVDTGTGMTPEVMARAFDPFFTTKPIGQGTGLGLSMIYGFARQSEGYVKIESTAGKGTSVNIYLPKFFGGEDHSEVAIPVSGENHSARDGEIVLVVEDEPAVRKLVVEVLEDLGYKVLEAADGPGGLDILQGDDQIDLLVTDVGLPGLNGRQLADAARETRPDLKILFMTGYAENAAMAEGFLEHGMEMITKPFAIDLLTQRIQTMAGKC